MKEIKEKKQMVRKHNHLINAKQSFTLVETRLILKLLSLLKQDDEKFKPFKIKVSDFADITKDKRLSEHERVKGVMEGLGKRRIHIELDHGFLNAGWIASAHYFGNDGIVEIEISEKLRPYLLQLKNCFTTYELKNILNFKSRYSFRIYELLKQYEKIGRRNFVVKELKETLQIENKYKLYQDFKRNVLFPAQKELKKHTDICFEFLEKKTGRKVTDLKFIIYSNANKTKQKPASEAKRITQEQVRELTSLFNSKTIKYKINEDTMQSVIKKYAVSYERLFEVLTQISFNSSYLPFKMFLAVLKGSYILQPKQGQTARINKDFEFAGLSAWQREKESKEFEEEYKAYLIEHEALPEAEKAENEIIINSMIGVSYKHKFVIFYKKLFAGEQALIDM